MDNIKDLEAKPSPGLDKQWHVVTTGLGTFVAGRDDRQEAATLADRLTQAARRIGCTAISYEVKENKPE